MSSEAVTASPTETALDWARERVTACLVEFLDDKIRQAIKLDLPPTVAEIVKDFVIAGGKRIRPLMCVAGWLACGKEETPDTLIQVAAALELYQAFALIHDDVMDKSATRRSRPTVHRELADRYTAASDPRHLGESVAIMVGNMALTWSDELLATAVLAERQAPLAGVINAMREEMHYGQYLDLTSTLGPIDDQRTSMTVIRYKTAKYTIERPLHIGAILAGAGTGLLDVLSGFALPLGDAFQLRDDVLGLYGNPATTGKPIFDDLREGKRTVVLALAAREATASQRALLERCVGDSRLNERDAQDALDVIAATGAVATVESMIAERYAQALAVLDAAPIPPSSAKHLRALAALCVERDA
ncbi:polyprenyl synthetase family protein [Streptomyces sp. AM6-12]|uniref:polyprenyl synthetase family protein n=1 Tax=Streptomyces sp. AM6-12 TaxID=3345149 RepID=UPI00378EBDC7